MSLFEVKDLSASYVRNGTTVELFSGLSFSLDKATITDLIGTSGSGKSTLLRVLALMLKKTKGSISLDGKESSEYQATQWRRLVCLVPQTPSLVQGTVKDNLLLPWKFKVRKTSEPPHSSELEKLLDKAGLSEIELSRDASQLSGGQAARVALLRAFITKPRVLLLDEVDAALDDDTARLISALTQEMLEEGAACLRIRHRASDGLATRTLDLHDGTLSLVPAEPKILDAR